jgi:hypothetical protein
LGRRKDNASRRATRAEGCDAAVARLPLRNGGLSSDQ